MSQNEFCEDGLEEDLFDDYDVEAEEEVFDVMEEAEEADLEELEEVWLCSPVQILSRPETPIPEEEERDRSRSPLARDSAGFPEGEEPVVIVGHREGAQRGRGRDSRRSRSGRGRLGANVGRRRPQDTWRAGDPIHQIYVSDDDVPHDLRDKIISVCARRKARQRLLARREDDDEYFDAEDGGDAALFRGDENACHFEWRTMDTSNPVKETFIPHSTMPIGPTIPTESAYEAFRQYWGDDILTHIATETNRYAATRAFADWYDTNIHEILVLFSFWMMLGIIPMPSIKACFSQNYLLTTKCFRIMFTRHRYERLCSCLQFNNDADQTPESSKLFPIDPILTYLNAKFQEAYIPRQEICIDESMTLWKGNLPFRKYIKNYATKFGIKTYELCESATGYLWSFLVDTGKDTATDTSLPSSLLRSSAYVLTLVTPLLNKGYTLFMGKCFNNPLLARFLKRNKTDVVGTMRANVPNVPPLIKHCELQAGQFVARHSGDMMVMAYRDRNKITLLSTCHGTETAQALSKLNRPAWKPQLVLDYNKSMGGVDLKDGMLEFYLLERKRCQKWHLKLFKHLLNCSILNARICFEASTGARKLHNVFRLELVDQILSKHLELVLKPQRRAPLAELAIPHARYTDNRHWPRPRSTQTSNRIPRRRCMQCKKRLTIYECPLCDVGLCVDVCFGQYHTRP